MKIISKYLLKEHLGPFIFSLTALTSIMLLQFIARRFGDVVGKGLSWWVITKFFVLSVPFTVAMTMPMAVLVAVLYAFSRLAAENEVTALKAGGVSMRTLMIPVIWAGLATAFVMLLFNDQVLPRANHELAQLQQAIFNTKPTFVLRPQVINEVKPGQLYLRAVHIDEATSKLRGVTIYDLSDPTRRRTVYADSGDVAMAPNQKDLAMTLYHGEMQTVETQRPEQLTRLFYNRDKLSIVDVMRGFQGADTTGQKSDREMSVCEMQTALTRQAASFQKAQFDVDHALWSTRKAKGIPTGPEPKATAFRKPVGLGGLYCAIADRLQNLVKVKELHAETLPVPMLQSPPQGAPTPRPQVPPAVNPSPAVGAPSSGYSPDYAMSEARLRLEDARYYVSRYNIEIQKKFALAAACVVFVLIGAPVALRFPRGGVGLVIGVSFFIFSVYYVFLIAGEALANKGSLSPEVAMWGANELFLIIAIPLLLRMGREAASTRAGGMREILSNAGARIARLFGARREYAA